MVFKKIDQLLTKFEQIGFRWANTLHIYTVNTIIMGCVYLAYTIVRDYHYGFLSSRVPFRNILGDDWSLMIETGIGASGRGV